MFSHKITIELQHTDAYGILFFANQFILCHGCFQVWLESVGIPLPPTRQQASELMVIVRAESDYLAPIHLSDHLVVHLRTERIGTTSVTNVFTLTRQGAEVGRVRTVHVLIDPQTSAKKPLPANWRAALESNL